MLSPVRFCKYFRTRSTDFKAHTVFAIFSVTDEGVHSFVYSMVVPCKFFFCNNAIRLEQWLTYTIFIFYRNHTHVPVVLQIVHFPIVPNSHQINVYRLAYMKQNTMFLIEFLQTFMNAKKLK